MHTNQCIIIQMITINVKFYIVKKGFIMYAFFWGGEGGGFLA